MTLKQIDKEGVYKMVSEEYLKDPVVVPSLSRSMIKDLLFSSPAHACYNNPRFNPHYKNKENEKFDAGTVAHSLLLESTNNVVVVEADDWRTKAAKETRDKARKEGKISLLKHHVVEVNNMVEVAKKHIRECEELEIENLSDGDSELTYIWKEDDIWLRIRPDWISKDRKLILDYKTTGKSANPEDIGRHIVSMGYDIQASLYTRGVSAIEKTMPKFVFLFQENYEPYLCSFISLPPEFLEMGKQKVECGKYLWAQCLTSEQWDGYPNRVCYCELPAWSLAYWENIAQKVNIPLDKIHSETVWPF